MDVSMKDYLNEVNKSYWRRVDEAAELMVELIEAGTEIEDSDCPCSCFVFDGEYCTGCGSDAKFRKDVREYAKKHYRILVNRIFDE